MGYGNSTSGDRQRRAQNGLVALDEDSHWRQAGLFSFTPDLNVQGLNRIRSLFPKGDDLIVPELGFALEKPSKLLEGWCRLPGPLGPRILQALDTHVAECAAVRQTQAVLAADCEGVHTYNPV